MTRLRYLVWLCLLGLALPTLVQAQGGSSSTDLVVLQTVAEDVDGQTRLKVYFVLRDRDGQPAIRDDLRDATLNLDGETTPITLREPTDPIKIALVIDGSGSMNDSSGGKPLIDEVRAAAARMVDAAPSNAEFAVFTFAEWFERQHESFLRKSDQAELIKDAIRTFPINESNTGDTCLYDAASKAIDALVAAQPAPSERLSVVLFTDGKDRQAGGERCTELGADEVINKANYALANPIPVYTIGVCMGQPGVLNPCANVNRDELVSLAEKTRAFPVIGPRNELDSLFTRLMDGLRSQWVAEATVCADAGRHVALLTTTVDDQLMSEDVEFEAAQTCLPPTTVEVSSQIYKAESDTFEVELDLANPQRIVTMTVGVYIYAEGGSQVATPLVFERPSERLSFTLPSDGMRSGSDYFLRISAVDDNGRPVLNAEGSPVLEISKFPYQSKLDFSIQSVEPSWIEELLVVGVKVTGVGARAVQFGGDLRDPETGKSEPLLPVMYQGGELHFPVPRMLREAGEPRTYELVLTVEDNGVPVSKSFMREIEPPDKEPGAPVGLWLLGIAGVVLTGGIAAFALLRRPRPALKIVAPSPGDTVLRASPAAAAGPTAPEGTVLAGGVGGTMLARQLRLRVVETPAPGSALERTVSSFPFIVGRQAGGLILPHDNKLSAKHLRIDEAARGFSVTDLGSSNGTWVGERRLAAGEQVEFNERIAVRLGPDTLIEIQPHDG